MYDNLLANVPTDLWIGGKWRKASDNARFDVIARIHQEMNGGDPAFHTIPGSSELIAQYLLLYSMSSDAGDFGTLVDYDYQRAKVQVMLTTSEQRDHRRLYEAFQRFAEERMDPEVRMEFGGEVMFWLAQIHHIAVGKVFNILTALGIVLLFCSLIFRSLSAGASVLEKEPIWITISGSMPRSAGGQSPPNTRSA